MKILFFLINMNLGGTEKSFLNLLEQLPQETKVDLLLLEASGKLLEAVPANVKVKTVENSELINELIRSGSRRFAFSQFRKGRLGLALQAFMQFIREKTGNRSNPYRPIHSLVKPIVEEYDITVAYAGIHNFIAWYILTQTKAKKKVVWVHFDVEKVVNDFSFGKKWYPLFSQLFCVSKNAKNAFQKRFPGCSDKTFTFNNIIAAEQLQQQAFNSPTFSDNFNGLRIVTLGRLSHEKGQQLIPAVVEKLKKDGYRFKWYLIGEGKLKEALREQIATRGLSEQLILTGSLLQPYAYLKDCDLYVQTSFYEGDPVALKEAKIFNKPVVTTHFSTVSDLIEHEQNGLIVDISEEGIYNGVRRMLADEALRLKLSLPAKQGNRQTKND